MKGSMRRKCSCILFSPRCRSSPVTKPSHLTTQKKSLAISLGGKNLAPPLSPPLPSPVSPLPEASADEAWLARGIAAAAQVAASWRDAAHGSARGRGACRRPLDGAEVPRMVCWIWRRRGGCRGGAWGAGTAVLGAVACCTGVRGVGR